MVNFLAEQLILSRMECLESMLCEAYEIKVNEHYFLNIFVKHLITLQQIDFGTSSFMANMAVFGFLNVWLMDSDEAYPNANEFLVFILLL